ncbi:MAG: hypothetical protein AAB332_05340 [Planctomycetota bacterium]
MGIVNGKVIPCLQAVVYIPAPLQEKEEPLCPFFNLRVIHLSQQHEDEPAGEFTGIEIACDQGGFACARRTRYPEDRTVPSRIHQTKQPLPGEDVRNLRAGDLCKRDIFL